MTDIAKQTDELIEDCASLQRQVLKRFTQSVLEEMKSTLMENKSKEVQLLEDYLRLSLQWMQRNGHYDAFVSEYPHVSGICKIEVNRK